MSDDEMQGYRQQPGKLPFAAPRIARSKTVYWYLPGSGVTWDGLFPGPKRDSRTCSLTYEFKSVNESSTTPRLLDYLRLFRIPNVFTAIADIAMGFLLVRGSPDPAVVFLLLAAASALIYTAGMVLNDVCDMYIERR